MMRALVAVYRIIRIRWNRIAVLDGQNCFDFFEEMVDSDDGRSESRKGLSSSESILKGYSERL